MKKLLRRALEAQATDNGGKRLARFQAAGPAGQMENRVAVEIETARNEYESAQIAVRFAIGVKNVAVSFSDLRLDKDAVIPASSLSYNFVGYVPVNKPLDGTLPENQIGPAPGLYPDPLLDQRSMEAAANQTQPIWIKLFTPENASPTAQQKTNTNETNSIPQICRWLLPIMVSIQEPCALVALVIVYRRFCDRLAREIAGGAIHFRGKLSF